MVEYSKKRLKKIARQKLSIRQSMWPDLAEEQLWNREKTKGWLTVPRAMPLLLRIMDILAPKGKPVSQTYLDLWCRTYDDSFVIVNKPREMAYYSGFSGERAERTWATRMRILAELGFIDIRPGTNGPIHYLLLYNPYRVITRHYKDGRVGDGAYNALKERVIEIRADEFDAELAPAKARPGPRKAKARSKPRQNKPPGRSRKAEAPA